MSEKEAFFGELVKANKDVVRTVGIELIPAEWPEAIMRIAKVYCWVFVVVQRQNSDKCIFAGKRICHIISTCSFVCRRGIKKEAKFGDL